MFVWRGSLRRSGSRQRDLCKAWPNSAEVCKATRREMYVPGSLQEQFIPSLRVNGFSLHNFCCDIQARRINSGSSQPISNHFGGLLTIGTAQSMLLVASMVCPYKGSCMRSFRKLPWTICWDQPSRETRFMMWSNTSCTLIVCNFMKCCPFGSFHQFPLPRNDGRYFDQLESRLPECQDCTWMPEIWWIFFRFFWENLQNKHRPGAPENIEESETMICWPLAASRLLFHWTF